MKYYLETGYIITTDKDRKAYGCLADWEMVEWCEIHHYDIIKKRLGLYGMDWLIEARRGKKWNKSIQKATKTQK